MSNPSLTNDVALKDSATPPISLKYIHGVFIEVFGKGVLLTGNSGIGKSETALALLDRKNCLISDDVVSFQISSCGKKIMGTCPTEKLQGFLEVRSLGILDVKHLFGPDLLKKDASLDLICELVSASVINRAERIQTQEQLLGMTIPKVVLPVFPGRNMALLVETMVRTQK